MNAILSTKAALAQIRQRLHRQGGQPVGVKSAMILSLNLRLIRPIILLLQQGILPVILRVDVGAMPREWREGLGEYALLKVMTVSLVFVSSQAFCVCCFSSSSANTQTHTNINRHRDVCTYIY